MPESTAPGLPLDAHVDTAAKSLDQVASVVTGNSWPERCSLAELARILTLMYGAKAPTESSLKKWSVTGVFKDCLSPEPLTEQQALPSFTREALMRPRRSGRPGLCLNTDKALDKVYEQWPHLADSTPNAVFQLAVAQASDRLKEAMLSFAPAVAPQPHAPSSPPLVPQVAAAPSQVRPVGVPATASEESQLDRIERLVSSFHAELASVKRELAQISSPRNNLLTKLDDAVLRFQQVLTSGARGTGGSDPLVEAKRDRDMGVLKGMLSEILDHLAAK